MLSMLSEVHFWTLREDVSIPCTDLGAYRYYEKKNHDDSTSFEGKKSYAEQRGNTWIPANKRPIRLKDNLKELEEHLSQQRLVLCQWRDCSLLQLMFSSGLFVNINVNVLTGDPLSITYDKYLVGKLLSDYVADVVLTKSHLICSYNDSQVTLVYFTKPTLKRTYPKSFSRLDPRIHTIELAGPTGRRLERKLVCNVSGDMFVVWWHCSHDEVYPWSPVVKDQDRANVLVYGVSGIKADLLCHHRSEFDLLSISFSKIHSNIVRAIEQKVSRSGDVTVESSSYQISRGSMQRTSAASIILPTHVCCHSFSPLQDKLLLGCIDGSLVMYDEALGVTHVVKAAFIPSILSWHPDGGIFIIGNERCQFQILDVALATLKQQLLSEDVTPGNLVDITSYFRIQPTLRFLKWNSKSDNKFYGENFVLSDCLLLLLFDRGPFAALRFVGGGGLTGDIHGTGGFTIDSLVAQYLWANQIDRAINLLLTLNWDIAGNTCLSCLQRIVNHLFKLPLTPDIEVQIQTVLGCFHMPVRPMCPTTTEEFKAPVRDLTRRFFHQLLRYQLYEKAFRLAIDLMERDLFMDIHFSAKNFGKMEIAEAAYKKAEELDTGSYESSTSGSSHSKCSRSSCSECSGSTSSMSDSEDNGSMEGRNEYHCQPASVKKKDFTRKTELQSTSPTSFENRPSTTLPYPPLPVVPSLATATSGQSSNQQGRNEAVKNKSMFIPPIWEKNSCGLLNRGIQANLQHLHSNLLNNENKLPSSAPLHAQAVQNERPKVKFCDTVMQIKLPDRLHTLPEEEEDTQSPPRLSSNAFFSSAKSSSHESRKDNTLQMMSDSPLSSFTLSANSVGIPIVPPVLTRTGFPDRRNIDSNVPPLPSHVLSGIPPCLSRPSTASHSVPWMVDSGKIMYPQGNIRPTLSSLYFDVRDCPQSNESHMSRGDLTYKRTNQGIDIDDPLGSEELSALLPGSRKPLASGTISYEDSLHSNSIGNGSGKSNSLDSNYFINYHGAVHDLSEEEENNGAIKIVHFGVV